jgi:flagellar protein FliJ
MTALDNRLRSQRWQLEERRRFLGDLEALAERLRHDVMRLQAEIAEEIGAAQALLTNGAMQHNPAAYPPFVRPLLDRRNKIQRSVAEIKAQIVEARQAVAAAQQELKLYEHAWARRIGDSAIGGAGPRRTRRTRRTEPTASLHARKPGD